MKKYSEIIHKVQPQDISNVMEKGGGDEHDLGGVINTATTVGSLALVCMGPIGIGCAIGLYALSMGLSFGLQLWGSKKDDKKDKDDKDSKDDKLSSKKDNKKETTNKTGNDDLDQLLQDPPSLSEVASVMSAALATKDNKMSDEEREKLQKRVDKLNQACFDENGKERSPEDAKKWLDDNTTNEELAELTEYCDKVVKDTNWKEVREQHDKNKKLTPSDLKDLLEARKESAIQAYEATKNKEKAQKELENAQSEKDKSDKELNQKNEEIANIEKEIKNLDKNSEGAAEKEKELNEKLEKAKEEQKELQKKKDDADEKWEDANKKLKDLSNPEPKEEPKKGEDGDDKTEPKKGEDGDTKTEPKEEPKKGQDKVKAEQEKELDRIEGEFKKESEKLISDFETKVKSAKSKEEREQLKKEFDENYKKLNEKTQKELKDVGDLGEEFNKTFEEEFKNAQEKSSKATDEFYEKTKNLKSDSEEFNKLKKELDDEIKKIEKERDDAIDSAAEKAWNDKKNKKTDPEDNSFEDEDGFVYKKDGDKYTMTDEKGQEIEIDKKDFEEAKEKAVDDEKEGDERTDNDDDLEDDDVDDKGNSTGKKDPRKIYKRRSYKRGNKSFQTKSYYDKKGNSISAKEFKEKVANYQKQQKNESIVYFLKNNLVVEGKRTINLSQYIKNRI